MIGMMEFILVFQNYPTENFHLQGGMEGGIKGSTNLDLVIIS